MAYNKLAILIKRVVIMMKILMCFLTILSIAPLSYGAKALDVAREAESIKVEYYETTQSGLVRVKGCSQCNKDTYKFDTPPLITKGGKAISIKEFMKEYWEAEFPTLLLDIKDLTVLSIHY